MRIARYIPAASLSAVLWLGCAQDRALTVPAKPAGSESCPAPPESPIAAEPASVAVKPKPIFQGRILLPPASPGDSQFELSGCLASSSTEAEGARFPPPSVSRGAPGAPSVRVNPMGKGIIVSHDLSHACCLQGHVNTRVEANKVILTEQLQGNACRCLCASTIRTAVGLAPGQYVLSVQLVQGDKTQVVSEQPFTVESASP